MKRLVGIMGRAGSGKDTVGAILRDNAWKTLAFADPLKHICQEVFEFTDEQLWGPSEERNAPDPRYPRPDGTCLTPREACQLLGTGGRQCYPDIWAELGLRLAKVERADVAITDVRFLNEAKAIRAAGGQVWRVMRPEADAVVSTHQSETEMNTPEMAAYVSHTIHNDSTIQVLRGRVVELIS